MHRTDTSGLCRNWKIVHLWLPVNVIFVGMIWTSFFALKNLGVPMATVLKNLTNLFTIFGDYTMYGKVRASPQCYHIWPVADWASSSALSTYHHHMQCSTEEGYTGSGAGVWGRGMGLAGIDVCVGHLRFHNRPGV